MQLTQSSNKLNLNLFTVLINYLHSFYRILSFRLALSKRKKIIITSIVITIGFIISTQITILIFLQLRLIIFIGVLTYILSLWSLWEGMTKTKAVVLLILPVLFAIAMPAFIFSQQLWQVRWLTRVPAAIIFGLAFYSLLLSQNVFNVASIRTIPLYRAASTVTFLFTLFSAFLIFHVLHIFNLSFYINALIIFAISFLLILPVLWSIKMEEGISSKILIYSFILSVITSEFGLVLSFWPIAKFSFMWSVGITAVLFTTLGIGVDQLRDRLTSKEVALYSCFVFFVFLALTFFTSWTG